MKDRFRKIIIPYIIISILLFLIFSLIFWLFVIKFALIDYDNMIFCNLFPALTSGIFVIFFFKKRVKLLLLTDKYKYLILLISWLLLTAPILTYQFYTYYKNGKLSALENTYDFFDNESSMFYSIQHSSQLKNKSVMYITKEHHMKEPEICVNSFFACPLVNQGDSTDFKNLWIGFSIGEQFSDRVFDDKKDQDRLIKNFIDSTIIVYKEHNFKTNYLKRITSSLEKEGFINAIKSAGIQKNNNNPIVFMEMNGDYKTRTGKSLWWTKFFLLVSNITWILFTSFPKMNNNAL